MLLVIKCMTSDHFLIRKFEKHNESLYNAGCWILTLLWAFYGRLKFKGHNVYINNHFIDYKHAEGNFIGF